MSDTPIGKTINSGNEKKNTQKIDEEQFDSVQQTISTEHVKTRKVFSRVRRELSDEELNSPGIQRLLLDELDKLEECENNLEDYKKLYHQRDKEKAVIQEQLKNSTSFEVLYSFSLSTGSALIGISPTIIEKTDLGWGISIIGLVMLIGGIVAKKNKR